MKEIGCRQVCNRVTERLRVRVATQGEGETGPHLRRGVRVGVVVRYTVRGVPMIKVGFAGSVGQGTSRDSCTTLTLPSFMLTLT